MEAEIPVEKRFQVLCEITRAQHFAWREAALAMAPDLDARELVNKMWEITGIQTARTYLKRLDPAKPLPMSTGSVDGLFVGVYGGGCQG